MIFRCFNIQEHDNEAVIYLNFGHLKMMNFPFGTNGKFIILGVPILKHIRVAPNKMGFLKIILGFLKIILRWLLLFLNKNICCDPLVTLSLYCRIETVLMKGYNICCFR